MSDLISRDAVIKELNELWRYVNFDSDKDVFDIIMKAKAIEQGEAVIDKDAYDGAREDLSIWKRRALEAEEKVRKYDQRIVDIGVIAMTPVTTPQQSQEQDELVKKAVADALEEVDNIKVNYTKSGRDDALTKIVEDVIQEAVESTISQYKVAIRALIKCDAKGVE